MTGILNVLLGFAGGGSPIFNPDSNSADLFLALPLTNYKSADTGGFYSDVSPLIRTEYGQTPGTAKTATSTGNGSQSSAIASPFAQYTDNLLVNTQTTNAHLFYYSSALNFNVATTVEFWYYDPSTTVGGGFMGTNNFGGGFYQGVSLSRTNATNVIRYFTNAGGTQIISSTGTVTRNAWNHIAYVFNGTGTSLKMFINGTEARSGAYNVDTGRTQFTIGTTNWDGITNSSGIRFQDYRIYTGVQKYTTSFTINLNNPDLGGRILA